jgi:HPt (histidine-containing phosphotransfer) domain-containing protein
MSSQSGADKSGAVRTAPFVNLELFRADLREGGVEEMLDMLLHTFSEDCPRRFAALESAIDDGDSAAIQSTAHAFKSGAVTIRAEVLAAALSRVEEAGRTGELASIPALLQQIREEHIAVMGQLDAMTRE